ncbi:ER lumen protein-retaining receptor 2-like [Planococcus citri]|uniref:ER lumen protein-retaining receptor 2-like n=1 Tax=Planococcus citri TaxID=170843 RepID=UPI0031F8F9B3
MNNFRIAGDIIHLIAVTALPIKIWASNNTAGVSGKTQILYALVCTSRYLDLFLNYIFISPYHTILKMLFISAAYLTVYLIYDKFKDTYSYNEDSFKIGYLLSAAAALAVTFNYGWSGGVIAYQEVLKRGFNFIEIAWAFSEYLEAVAILPQLLIIYRNKTSETKSHVFYYVYVMGLYRALYVMNWIYMHHICDCICLDVISYSAGVVQLTIYVMFAFIYVTGQSLYSNIIEPSMRESIKKDEVAGYLSTKLKLVSFFCK